MPKPSTFALKTSFLSSQVRTLEKLPPPPPRWRDSLAATEHGDLSDTAVQQVLYKLSIVARKHQNVVYSAQTLRHVAEQIDALYREVADEESAGRSDDIAVLRAGVDLRLQENIDALPETWLDEEGEDEADLEMYQTLRAKLVHAGEVLRAQRERRAHCGRLRTLVEPFARPVESVQPNLVTRDGPLNAELERTKMLAVLLAVEVEKAGLKMREKGQGYKEEGGDDEEEEDEEEDEDEDEGKLMALLN